MKEWVEKQVVVELDEVEEQAVETVLNFLERMTYLYEEEEVKEIFVKFDVIEPKAAILQEIPERAIQALEEITGVWK